MIFFIMTKTEYLIIRQDKRSKDMFAAEVYMVNSRLEGENRLTHEKERESTKYVALVKVVDKLERKIPTNEI